MKQQLVQLHPDFSEPLQTVLGRWNKVQSAIEFIGLPSGRDFEKSLLSAGEMRNEDASAVADGLRRKAGYSPNAGIIVFTEKRIHDDEYDQMYVGGPEMGEEPLHVFVLSLHFLRQAYSAKSRVDPYFFRAVLANILFSIGADLGLADHSRAQGCIMDRCDEMPDIEQGLRGGPKFCKSHVQALRSSKNKYLLELAEAARDQAHLGDFDVTQSLLLRGERYAKQPSRFGYDVALSLAGKDRRRAERLARELEQRRLKVYYDRFERAAAWGKNLDRFLSELYRIRARYCIVFVSKNYYTSRWTKLELGAALKRASEDEDQEYVLPIRLDDVEGPEELSDISYLNWHEETVRSIADLVTQKLAQNAKDGDAKTPVTNR